MLGNTVQALARTVRLIPKTLVNRQLDDVSWVYTEISKQKMAPNWFSVVCLGQNVRIHRILLIPIVGALNETCTASASKYIVKSVEDPINSKILRLLHLEILILFSTIFLYHYKLILFYCKAKKFKLSCHFCSE